VTTASPHAPATGERAGATPDPSATPTPPNTAPPFEAPPTALYVHVPFCVSHCPYCDFVVVAGRAARGPASLIEAFLAALHAELALRADALDDRWGAVDGGSRPPLASVYLGGGTPSLLSPAAVAALLEVVRARFGLAPGAEVTLEINPGPDERGDLAGFRRAGVTRASIGAQSFDASDLRALGRRHGPGDSAASVRLARSAGIDSVSLDLLYDLPGQSVESWSSTLDAALALEPDHLSVYALTLDDPDAEGITGPGGDHLPVRPGARRWRQRSRGGQDEDRAAAMYELADRRLGEAGYDWYELSSWARPGHRSRHNLAYWTGASWEALGPGAHAFDGATRRWTAAGLSGYLAALSPAGGAAAALPPGGAAAPASEPERAAESALLALRTRDGLPAASIDDLRLRPALTWALDEQLLERTIDDRVALTLRGRLLSNEVFARLV
jgi:oxygen-independent coproporphyrinogen-3 oxidase